MYSQIYINDFEEKYYKYCLEDRNRLRDLKFEYLKQYGDKSDALLLAFKESLDHYILKQLLNDDNYINSEEFANYLDYIMHIVEEKKQIIGNQIYNTEIVTNVVFRNEKVRKKVLSSYYNVNFVNSFEENIKSIKQYINIILFKMVHRERVTQEEIDLVGDYLYSSRNFKNDIGKIYAEYIFNEITPDLHIKVSIPMMGALISYCTQCYTIDDEVKNSRTFMTEFDKKNVDLAHKSANKKYCYFSKKYFGLSSLLKDDSLNTSRIFYRNHEDVDIYHLLMITFHELTHEHQHNEKHNTSSSGMAFIVKDVLNKNLGNYIRLDKNGNPINIDEYMVNHDSTEYEMQADEESWRQCQHFIAEHCRQYAYKHNLDTSSIIKREEKCMRNERAIRARRAFSFKIDKDNKAMYYSLYDIKNLTMAVQKNPSILKKYPVLTNYMDDMGNLKTSILFTTNITSKGASGLNVDNTGLEFATYIFDYRKNKILEKISSGTLTEQQIQTLIINIYNVMHQNVLKIRDFNKIEKKDYQYTSHHYDLENSADNVYNYFFKKNAQEIYDAIEILYTIRRYYPQIDISKYSDTKYYVSYFYELLANIKNISIEVIENLCKKYDSSQDPILLELSNCMKRNILKSNSITDEPQSVSEGTGIKR